MSNNKQFYENAARYWAKVPATLNGVLGGYGYISDIDINGSKAFLNNLLSLQDSPNTNIALDCGAGIGRVSKNLLISYFDKVDLVEQDSDFIKTAKLFIGEDNKKLGTLYQEGLQYFKPAKKYDIIWCQWVLGYLNDYDLIDFLRRCRNSLNINGLIVIKENIAPTNELEYDEEDSSVTRPYKYMLTLFEEALLQVVEAGVQEGFPDEIYPVHMFALRPK